MVEPRNDASALVRATGEILVELRDLVTFTVAQLLVM